MSNLEPMLHISSTYLSLICVSSAQCAASATTTDDDPCSGGPRKLVNV